jgi:hypothetical protein
MSKTAIGGQYALTASYQTLATLLGLTGLGKIELSLNSDRTGVTTIQMSDAAHPIAIAAAVIWNHEFAAVDLATVSVKTDAAGAAAGDKITIAGEQVEPYKANG